MEESVEYHVRQIKKFLKGDKNIFQEAQARLSLNALENILKNISDENKELLERSKIL